MEQKEGLRNQVHCLGWEPLLLFRLGYGQMIPFFVYLYGMKIILNGKEINVISDENNVIKIKNGLDDLDIQFFKRWENDCFDRKWKEARYGKCLSKTIDFYDDVNDIHGILIGCVPKIDGKSINISYEIKELRE